MKKTRYGIIFLLSVLLLKAIWDNWGTRLKFVFQGPLTLQRIQRIWTYSPMTLIMMVVSLALVIVAVSSFTKILKGNPGRTTRRRSTEKKPVHAGKYVQQEEALHCQHLTGRQKYLEQIDSYLRTGLIDRSEYRVLKERYMKIDIPDDYH